MIAPLSFVLIGPAGSIVANGIHTSFRDAAEASAALRNGSADVVVGALPFHSGHDAALLAPVTVTFGESPRWSSGELPAIRIAETVPPSDEHRTRIVAALQKLQSPTNSLQKVVLARGLRLVADAPIDPHIVLQRLISADPQANAYLADLSPAGGDCTGAVLLGASPELLVARTGTQVTCRPFAGSAPRATDAVADAANGAALAASAKNRHEHQLVVDAMRTALEPLCSSLEIAPEPTLSRTAALWHLSTPICGTLRESSTTAIDLALALHPTPAVGGVPTKDAMDVIAELEGDRGFYAGAVGWCDAHGDGRWVVAIRGTELSADRRTAVAMAGGGIVAESDPDDEIAETTTKFRTILSALGVQE